MSSRKHSSRLARWVAGFAVAGSVVALSADRTFAADTWQPWGEWAEAGEFAKCKGNASDDSPTAPNQCDGAAWADANGRKLHAYAPYCTTTVQAQGWPASNGTYPTATVLGASNGKTVTIDTSHKLLKARCRCKVRVC